MVITEEVKEESMSKTQIQNEIKALENTNKWFKKQIEPEDCGWMHTTIDGNKHRIRVLKDILKTGKQKHWSNYL
jgi:hypothetical protein